MGLSRRTFTKEFKLAAVRRLEAGVSMAEVARGLEVSPSVLQRWRQEFRHAPGNAFPGNGQRRWSEGRWLNWNARSASRRWRSIF
jgi:transposase-like protein